MSTKYSEKDNVDAVEFSADNWTAEPAGADGSRSYTANADGASCTVKFRPPRGDQVHDPMKSGSKVTRHADGPTVGVAADAQFHAVAVYLLVMSRTCSRMSASSKIFCQPSLNSTGLARPSGRKATSATPRT